ncbi:MAG TPA: hypothetical protein VM536_21750 [Chloroflexia bacterium]|nr:hypothetical protein [Chloroflexia bacterium]
MAPGTNSAPHPAAKTPLDPDPGVPLAAGADPLARLGLESTVPLLSDLVRPFAWLGAQALLVLQPSFALFGAGNTAARLIRLLEHPDGTGGPPPEEKPCP